MTRDAIALAFLAAGHCALWVYVINVVHALGLDERRMTRLKVVLLSALAATTALLVWLATRGPISTWPWIGIAYAAVCLAIALVGLPLVTLLRGLRRRPDLVDARPRLVELDLAREEGLERLIGPGRHAWMLRLPGNESLRLQKLEWEVALPNLPPAWNGLSLVHLSDLHFAPCFDRRFFERVIEEAAGWNPDLVAFTGDLTDHDDALDWIVPVLGPLSAKLGKFAILGNHDLGHHPERMRRLLEDAGFQDMEGRWASIPIDGATLAVGGTSSPWGPALDPDVMPEAELRLLLSHTPDLFFQAARWGIDLMLSGHNHGGQVRFPGLGPVFMPSLFSRHFDRGYFHRGQTLLHVSQGVGGKHPLRYGCRPEISRIVLRTGRDQSLPSGESISYNHLRRSRPRSSSRSG